jgi:hypothetical protein
MPGEQMAAEVCFEFSREHFQRLLRGPRDVILRE